MTIEHYLVGESLCGWYGEYLNDSQLAYFDGIALFFNFDIQFLVASLDDATLQWRGALPVAGEQGNGHKIAYHVDILDRVQLIVDAGGEEVVVDSGHSDRLQATVADCGTALLNALKDVCLGLR